ncbi:unnamed protein product [Phaedon cochleariae]|uniref:Uncharacterized protein n=1 Tax=Phaedon cochleariae TaxID=80249 RepID=A0A9P0DN86_PHACE|nr:unnamed protein product [Phaedon cochleariae]
MRFFMNTQYIIIQNTLLCDILLSDNCQIIISKMNSSFPQNNTEESEEEKLKQIFLEELNRRNENLNEFIDEFVNSEEYEEYLEMKRNIMKKNVAAQYCESDLMQYQEMEEEDKYPLTTRSRNMMAFVHKFEKYTKNKENLEFLQKQEKGIQIIKDAILELRQIFICTKQIREDAKKARDKRNLEKICQSFNIDYRIWKERNKHKITQRILCYQKILHTRKIKRNQNITAIVKKLVGEIKSKRKDEDRLKTPSHRIQRRDKIMKDMEIIGHHITLCSRYETVEDNADQEINVENRTEKRKEDVVKYKKVKQTKEKVKNVKNDKKKEKKSTITKGSKKSQKSKKEESEIVLPIVPICNQRNIITTEDIEKLDQLIDTFNKLDDIMEDKHLLAQITPIKSTMATNNKFLCKPQMITFNNFLNGKNYRKNLLIQNRSRGTQKLRFVGISSTQDYSVLLFRTQPLVGIQKLASGCSVHLTIFFTPIEETCEVDAALEFWTFDIESQRNEKFYVNVKCIPSHADLKISSDEIHFGKIPFWQRYCIRPKVLKLTNEGTEPCTVVIKKIQDILQLPETSEDDRKMEENDISNEVIDDIEERDIINEVIEELFENVFNTFLFEHLAIALESSQNVNLKVQMRNVDYIGNYQEKYLVDVYENNVHIGNKEIMLYAEVTDHFITVSPDILDFGVCILNSIYQLGLDINNTSSTTQAIAIKFPSSLGDYIRSDVTNLYVPPRATRKIWLKLSPRKSLFSDSETHFDKQTGILEFPIHVCTMSKNYALIPPVRAKIFAVLTEANGIAISAKTTEYQRGDIVDLGECSIYETVVTDLVIENRTLSPQIYGFLDLPQSVTLSPNLGYGTLAPEETKILQLSYHPDINDLKKFFREEKFNNYLVKFDINLDTISNLGQFKQDFSTKKLRRSIDMILKELRTPQEDKLYQHIIKLKDSVRLEYFPESHEYAEELNKRLYEYDMEIANECSEANFFRKYPNMKPVAEKSTISITAKILRPLLELSCQYLELPDTPCGSYSFVEIELKALKSEFTLECDFLKKSSATSLPNYEAWFKITGDNEELRIEPTCGTLRNGETRKLILVAKPSIPESIIQDTARSIKYTEIYEKRKQDLALRKLKSRSKGKLKEEKKNIKENKREKKETKSKQKKTESKSKTKMKSQSISKTDYTEESHPKIEITESEIILDYLDYYPAEMCYWRTLEPYMLQSKMVCSIDYYSTSMIRRQETIYLDASVRVVRPDFITNLKTQRINFGNVAVGMSKTEHIILQNIQYNSIKPKTSLLNPVGPFRIPYMRDTNVPPEHYLKLPVIFEPVENNQVEEYFEITSGRTILSLILDGKGVTPEIDFKPNNSVFRLESPKNKAAECTLQIINKSSAKLKINFEKVVELEGFFREIDRSQLEICQTKDVDHEKKGNRAKKSQKPEKSKQKVSKKEAVSGNLTEVEKDSIRNNFTKIEGASFFELLNVEENQLHLEESSSKSIKIGFGTTEALLKKKKEIKESGKKEKASKSPSDKKSTESSKQSKKSTDKKYYVVKYNIKLCNNFLKDIILICSFK